MNGLPDITRVPWQRATEVLGHEERGFSAWLAENLWLLEDALELDGLTLVDREVRVESYRADLVATADDGTDEGLPVIIENQYGKTNHDHLGKLVTYLAAWQRGLGVWVVEDASDTHVAAVEFLNRTSSDDVGYALLVVRFAPAPRDQFYVDADVVARPNAWREITTARKDPRSGSPERLAFLEAVHERVEDELVTAGWQRTRLSRGKPHIRLWPPQDTLGGYATLRAAPHEFALRHIIEAGSLEASVRAIELLRARYGARLESLLPEGTEVRWHRGRDRANAANDQIAIVHPDGGYQDLEPAEAAEWALTVGGAWAQLLIDDPPGDLLEQARRDAAAQLHETE